MLIFRVFKKEYKQQSGNQEKTCFFI